MVRTTLNIDDDVLAAAKELARSQHTSAGRVISQLLRQAISGQTQSTKQDTTSVGGFRPFAARGQVVTDEKVNELRDAEGV